MAPTESRILTTHLTLPAELPTIMSLQEFTAIFPKAVQSSPHIRSLYRDLQHQRNLTIDRVKQNIEAEVKAGAKVRRELVSMKRAEQNADEDDEIEIERALFGASNPGTENAKHTINSIIPEMDSAARDMETEIKALEQEEAALMESLKQSVGGMSDLRYGRFSNANLTKEVYDGLRSFQAECEKKT